MSCLCMPPLLLLLLIYFDIDLCRVCSTGPATLYPTPTVMGKMMLLTCLVHGLEPQLLMPLLSP